MKDWRRLTYQVFYRTFSTKEDPEHWAGRFYGVNSLLFFFLGDRIQSLLEQTKQKWRRELDGKLSLMFSGRLGRVIDHWWVWWLKTYALVPCFLYGAWWSGKNDHNPQCVVSIGPCGICPCAIGLIMYCRLVQVPLILKNIWIAPTEAVEHMTYSYRNCQFSFSCSCGR